MKNEFHKRFRILYEEMSDSKILTMTRQEYADQVGVTKNQVSGWMDKQTEPSLDSLIAIAKVHNVSLDWLFGVSDIRNPYMPIDTELALLIQERSSDIKEILVQLIKKM